MRYYIYFFLIFSLSSCELIDSSEQHQPIVIPVAKQRVITASDSAFAMNGFDVIESKTQRGFAFTLFNKDFPAVRAHYYTFRTTLRVTKDCEKIGSIAPYGSDTTLFSSLETIEVHEDLSLLHNSSERMFKGDEYSIVLKIIYNELDSTTPFSTLWTQQTTCERIKDGPGRKSYSGELRRYRTSF